MHHVLPDDPGRRRGHGLRLAVDVAERRDGGRLPTGHVLDLRDGRERQRDRGREVGRGPQADDHLQRGANFTDFLHLCEDAGRHLSAARQRGRDEGAVR